MLRIWGCLALMAAGSLQMSAQEKMINLNQADETIVQQFTQAKLADCIMECPTGASFPLRLTIEGEFLHSASISTLKILKTCYIRCQEPEHFLFSADKQHWSEFEVFFTGEVRA